MSEDRSHAETLTAPPAAGHDEGMAPILLARRAPALSQARMVGELVAGKYQLTEFLARGGMGEVWRGTHAELRTDVAIKFVDGQLAAHPVDGPDALQRFRFEAQISAQLATRTRHVVAVHDAGTHMGVPYLVMEFVPGQTLDAEVEK